LKKYSKLIILMTIAVVVLAVYYGQTSSLSKSFAQYEIKTIEGDDAVIDPIMIKGDFYSSHLNNEPFILTKDKVHYERDSKLFERFNDVHLAQKVAKLQKENRNFMRMKDYDPINFITEGDTIIYVTVPYTRWGISKDHLHIESYNQKTKEKKINEINEVDFKEYSNIEALFVSDNHLYIAVASVEYDVSSELDEGSYHIFNYDLASESLVDSYEIDLDGEDYYSQKTAIFADKEENPTELVVVSSILEIKETPSDKEAEEEQSFDEEIEISDEEYYEEVSKVSHIEKIDLKTGERTETEFKSNLKNSIPMAYDGAELKLLSTSDNGELTISVYDFAKHKVTEKFTVKTDLNMMAVWDFSNIIIDDGKIYMLVSNDDEKRAQILVIDMAETSLLYQGSVELQVEDSLLYEDSEVYFHTLELKE